MEVIIATERERAPVGFLALVLAALHSLLQRSMGMVRKRPHR
jgi:hypothetical protein